MKMIKSLALMFIAVVVSMSVNAQTSKTASQEPTKSRTETKTTTKTETATPAKTETKAHDDKQVYTFMGSIHAEHASDMLIFVKLLSDDVLVVFEDLQDYLLALYHLGIHFQYAD